jgi:hypothetical protein
MRGLDRVLRSAQDPDTAGTELDHGQDVHLIPALLSIRQTVDGATAMPSPASSPWIK